MGEIADLANAAWRDWPVAGVPTPGTPHRPNKADIRALFAVIDDKLGTAGDGADPISYGADPTGAVSSNAAFVLARDYAIANNVPMVISAGTYLISGFAILSGLEIRGRGIVILKRPAADAGTAILSAVGQSRFKVIGLDFDGNAANNSVGSDNIYISGCADFEVRGTKGRNAKYNAGRGNHIYVADSTDATSNTRSWVEYNEASDNAVGILVQRCNSITVSHNHGEGNTYGGIKIDDPTVPVPVGPILRNIEVSDNEFTTSGVGVGIFGDRSSVTALGDVLSQTNHLAAWVNVFKNRCYGNQYYGLAVQASGVTAIGNVLYSNGSDTSNGGMLFNSLNGVCEGNVIVGNHYYGLDAGFSYRCLISDNIIYSNGKTLNQGIGLNLGATNSCKVSGNRIGDNGGNTGGSYQVLASGIDGSLSSWAPFTGYDLDISDNEIELTHSAMTGVRALNGFQGVSIKDNRVINRVGGTPFELLIAGDTLRMSGNEVLNPAGNWVVAAASASTAVIPDYGDVIAISGTATVDHLRNQAHHSGVGSLITIVMTNIGSGYTSVPTVVFTGGGGTGAAGIAALAADGKIYGVYITNKGTGYTSAPTISFTGGGGAGAAATAYLGDGNGQTDRIITLRFDGACTFKNGTGNLSLAGADFVATGAKTLTLRSAFGNWYEVART